MATYKSYGRVYFFILVGLVIVIILHYLHVLRKLEDLWRRSFAPVLSSSYSFNIAVGDTYEFFKNRDEFLDAYKNARTELAKLESIEAKYKLAIDENDELRKELNFKKAAAFPLINANVIGHNLSDLEKTVLIDRGEQNGLKEGMPVIAGDGVMVGKIATVYPASALVRLISDSRSKIAVTVLNKDKSIGIVESGFGVSLQMTNIPRNESVQINDKITTSGLEDFIPRGLLIGNVSAIQNEAYQSFQQAVITPTVDAAKLSIVSVLLTH